MVEQASLRGQPHPTASCRSSAYHCLCCALAGISQLLVPRVSGVEY